MALYQTPSDLPTEMTSLARMLIQGPPNSGKTEAVVRTWPRPLQIQVYPGEGGHATIPQGFEARSVGIAAHIPTLDPTLKITSGAVVQEVEALTFEILGGKHGPVESFCGDGMHKYYLYVLDMVSGGQLFRGENIGSDTDPYVSARIYNRAREHFRYYIQRINASPVKNVVFTCWDGREADKASQGFKGMMHIFPDLPGKAAKEIMGEFGVVVYSIIEWGNRLPNKLAPAKWQLIPEGEVWGAAIKAPSEVIKHLPVYCAQDYNVLKQTLADAWAKSQVQGAK